MQDFRYVGLDISLKQRALGDIHFCFLSQLAYNSEILSKFAEDKLHLGKAIKQACFFAETSLRRHLLKTSLRNTRHLT